MKKEGGYSVYSVYSVYLYMKKEERRENKEEVGLSNTLDCRVGRRIRKNAGQLCMGK